MSPGLEGHEAQACDHRAQLVLREAAEERARDRPARLRRRERRGGLAAAALLARLDDVLEGVEELLLGPPAGAAEPWPARPRAAAATTAAVPVVVAADLLHPELEGGRLAGRGAGLRGSVGRTQASVQQLGQPPLDVGLSGRDLLELLQDGDGLRGVALPRVLVRERAQDGRGLLGRARPGRGRPRAAGAGEGRAPPRGTGRAARSIALAYFLAAIKSPRLASFDPPNQLKAIARSTARVRPRVRASPPGLPRPDVPTRHGARPAHERAAPCGRTDYTRVGRASQARRGGNC